MKIFKTFYFIIISILLMMTFACQEEKKAEQQESSPQEITEQEQVKQGQPQKMLQENIETKVHTEAETMKTTSEIGLSPAASEYAFLLYLKIKDGLVAADEGTVHQFSIEFEDIVRSEGSEAVTPRLLSSAKEMMETKNIEAQRKQFAILSQEMYALLKVHKPEGMTLYKQFCPIAFDKKGAYWISDVPAILNPYFGNKMLHSGKIQEEF